MLTTLMVLLIVFQLMTFGIGNNDPAWVLEQHLQLGVTAAIVDDVPKVHYCYVLQLHLPRHNGHFRRFRGRLRGCGATDVHGCDAGSGGRVRRPGHRLQPLRG